ncbi:hypothetical protein GCM10017562_01780 [Streptomyces roseofulvus]|uniref:hypothetical protein n=1 Tax=Streptomyces roseofulvus TaxID=33902 RepID=UPI0031FA39DD
MVEEGVEAACLVGQRPTRQRQGGHLGAEAVQDVEADRHLRPLPHGPFLPLFRVRASGPRPVLLLHPLRAFVCPSLRPAVRLPSALYYLRGRTDVPVSER